MVEVAEQGACPPRRIDAVAHVTVKVAIRAFRPAERPVDVDCERVSRPKTVAPAKAGAQGRRLSAAALGSRFRGNDRLGEISNHLRRQLSTSWAKARARGLSLCW